MLKTQAPKMASAMMTPIIGTNPRKLAWPLTRIVLPSTKTYSHLKWPAINAAAPTKKSSRPVTYVYGTHIDVNASGSMTNHRQRRGGRCAQRCHKVA